MPMKWTTADPNANDLLFVFWAARDVTRDNKVRLDRSGLLVSEKHSLSMPVPSQVPLVQWRRNDAGPMKIGGAYVLAEEPPMPDEDAEFMNVILPGIYEDYVAGETHQQKRERKDKRNLKILLTVVVVAAFIVSFVLVPLWRPPKIIQQSSGGAAASSWISEPQTGSESDGRRAS